MDEIELPLNFNNEIEQKILDFIVRENPELYAQIKPN